MSERERRRSRREEGNSKKGKESNVGRKSKEIGVLEHKKRQTEVESAAARLGERGSSNMADRNYQGVVALSAKIYINKSLLIDLY